MYDGNGNVTSKTAQNGTTTFVYDAAQRLRSITGPDGNETNVFSADGQRRDIASPAVSGEIRPQYDLSGNAVVDLGNDNTLWNYRLFGPGTDEPLAEWWRVRGHTIYLHHDALGSVTAVTKSDGTVAYRESYKVFGQTTLGPNPGNISVSRMTFTGREASVGGLMQYRSRYYDSSAGRFLQQDRYQGESQSPPSLNRYVYTLNSPVDYTDPSGHSATGYPVPGGEGGAFYITLLAAMTFFSAYGVLIVWAMAMGDNNFGDTPEYRGTMSMLTSIVSIASVGVFIEMGLTATLLMGAAIGAASLGGLVPAFMGWGHYTWCERLTSFIVFVVGELWMVIRAWFVYLLTANPQAAILGPALQYVSASLAMLTISGATSYMQNVVMKGFNRPWAEREQDCR